MSSVKPLSVWISNDFYLRFSASDYSPFDVNDRFSHLTNNSVTKYSGDTGNKHFKGLMWTKSDFLRHLETVGRADQIESIISQVRETVKQTILAGCSKFGSRRNSFVVFGFDLMVDSDFRVWLIEVNAAPSMELSTVRLRGSDCCTGSRVHERPG